MVIKMSSNQVKDNLQTNRQVLIQQQISTPLPPPEWMEKYNNINPSITNAILEQYVKNSDHFRAEDNKKLNILEKETKTISISQWHGFIATILILLSALFCAYIRQKEIALGFLGLSFVGIVQALIRKK